MDNIVIIGNSSTARTIYRFIMKYDLFHVVGFAIHERFITSDTFCDLPLFSIESLENVINKEKDYVFVAIQWNLLNRIRRDVYNGLKDAGFRCANLISPTAVVNGSLKGDNCWIADLAAIDFGAKIGSDVFVKVMAMIGPSTKVEDHCFIGAKSTIGGGSLICSQSFVGINATIFDEVHVGKKSIIGGGTILKRSVPDFTIVKSRQDTTVMIQSTETEIENKLIAAKNVRN